MKDIRVSLGDVNVCMNLGLSFKIGLDLKGLIHEISTPRPQQLPRGSCIGSPVENAHEVESLIYKIFHTEATATPARQLWWPWCGIFVC